MDKLLNLVSSLEGNFRSRLFSGTLFAVLLVLIYKYFFPFVPNDFGEIGTLSIFLIFIGFVLIYSLGVIVEFYGKTHISRMARTYAKLRKISKAQKKFSKIRAYLIMVKRVKIRNRFLPKILHRIISPMYRINYILAGFSTIYIDLINRRRDIYLDEEFFTNEGRKYYNALDNRQKMAFEDVFSDRHSANLDVLEKHLTDERKIIIRRYRSIANDFIMIISTFVLTFYFTILCVIGYFFTNSSYKYFMEISHQLPKYITGLNITPLNDELSTIQYIGSAVNLLFLIAILIWLLWLFYKLNFGALVYQYYKYSRKNSLLMIEMLAS
ncbi:MAG: hypothetical protein GY789_28120 [Hyphomicrobiales bacterium]|nr:hypothetical protein [Hyphomicrobiales bacterium]